MLLSASVCYQPAGFASMASTRAVAHALATADLYFSFTLATQPALLTKSPRLQELSFFKSTTCSGCCSPFATQSGVSAKIVASWALADAIFPAVPPVTQPPDEADYRCSDRPADYAPDCGLYRCWYLHCETPIPILRV